MLVPDLTLKFEISSNRNPDALKAVNALLAWVDILKTSAMIVEPNERIRIVLVGVEEGSQIFKFALENIEEFLQDISNGAKEYPLVSKAAITLGGLIVSSLITIGMTNAFSENSDAQFQESVVLQRHIEALRASNELMKAQMRFYGILQDEPAYEKIEVLGINGGISYSVPRSEFAARSGLWTSTSVAEEKLSTQDRVEIWRATLIKPVLVSKPRRWRFAKDGVEFSAQMQDLAVLSAIHDKTLPIRLEEGLVMTVEVQYRERWVGSAWIPVSGSHKIIRVIEPLPIVSASSPAGSP